MRWWILLVALVLGPGAGAGEIIGGRVWEGGERYEWLLVYDVDLSTHGWAWQGEEQICDPSGLVWDWVDIEVVGDGLRGVRRQVGWRPPPTPPISVPGGSLLELVMEFPLGALFIYQVDQPFAFTREVLRRSLAHQEVLPLEVDRGWAALISGECENLIVYLTRDGELVVVSWGGGR